jgi:hypothetical protein
MRNHFVISRIWQLRVFVLLLFVSLVSASARLANAENNTNSGPDNRNASQGNSNNNRSQAPGGETPNQPSEAGTTDKPGEAPQPAAQDPSKAPKVIGVSGNLALFNTVTVKVRNFQELFKQADNDLSKIILHLDGYPLKGINVRRVSDDGPQGDELQYDLKRTDDPVNNRSWNALLGRPDLFPEPTTRKVRVSVGLENRPVDTDFKEYEMTVINYKAYWIYVLCLIVFGGFFLYLAYWSNLLRDPGPNPPREKDVNGVELPEKSKPFSLARTQMAMWFFVIVASFIFIWMVTSNASSLTSTVLGLIGISAGTGLASVMIDSNKRAAIDKQKADLDTEGKTLDVQITQLRSQIGAATDPAAKDTLTASLAAKEARLAQVKKELADLNASDKPLESNGFFHDILSDDNGINFHRFQIFIWTIALIIIFIASVYNVLAMPEFDGTLLALMGISSGTYLGFKVPENRVPPKDETPAGGAPAQSDQQAPTEQKTDK